MHASNDNPGAERERQFSPAPATTAVYLRVARQAVRPEWRRTLRSLVARSRFYWTPHHVQAALAAGWRRRAAGDIDGTLAALATDIPNDVELHIAAMIVARSTGRSETAREAFVRADQCAAALHMAGAECLRRNNPPLALSLLLRAAAALPFIAQERSRAPGVVLCDLATAFQDLSQFDVADRIYTSALESCPAEDASFRFQRSVVLSNIGLMRMTQGRFDEASRLLFASIDLLDQCKDVPLTESFAALVNAGRSEQIRGKSDTARALLDRAQRIGRKVGPTAAPTLARTLLHLADLDLEASDEAAAIRRWGATRRICRRAGLTRLEAETWSSQGDRWIKTGRLAAAKRCFLKAYRLLESRPTDEADERVEVRQLLADVNRLQGNHREASDWADKALELGRSSFGEAWIGNADSLAAVARIAWDRRDYEACRELRLSAAKILRAVLPDEHPRRLKLDAEVAEAFAATGHRGLALDRLAACLRTEARLMLRLIDRSNSILDLADLRTNRDQLELYLILMLEMPRISQERLRDLRDAILSFRGLGAETWRRSGYKTTLDTTFDVSAGHALQTAIALTETFSLNETRFRIVLVEAGGKITLGRLGETASYEDALRRWTEGADRRTLPILQTLADILISSTGENVSNLIWLPDSGLAIHPLASLPIDEKTMFVDRFVITQPRDAYALRRTVHPPSAQGALLIGLSEFRNSHDLDPLPGVIEEIADLSQKLYLLKPTIFLNDKATRGAVLAALRDKPRIIHMATHGQVANEHAESGMLRTRLAKSAENDLLGGTALVLATPFGSDRPDLLSARDIALVDLTGVKLAVLAACDSGAAPTDAGEGILGFQIALHAAGVETVATTLWPLQDNSTPYLISQLYAEILCGSTPAKALRTAQLSTRDIWQDLDSWGGWICSGPADVKVL